MRHHTSAIIVDRSHSATLFSDVIVSAAARRSILVGGCAPPVPQISEKILFYPQNFQITFFRHRKLQQNKYTAIMASAVLRQIIGGGAPINKSRRRGAHKLLRG